MKFRDFLTEKVSGKVIVVYGGGFQPFHQGHMSSYVESKQKFPRADYYVASSSDVKLRPIPFKDKKFLAQQAGVVDNFVQVVQPVNPQEIIAHYNENKDILILVRSEKDPVKYTKKDGSPAYYQPFVSIDKCEPFKNHAYIFVTKKKTFYVAGKQSDSGSQIRQRYSAGDDKIRRQMISDLYPKAKNPAKVKQLLDKYLTVKEDVDFEFEELLTEGVHDQSIFKAVFLAGGPGSGKDYVLDNTLQGHGLTEINLDKAIEFLGSKKGVDDIDSKAKNTTELRQKLALKGRNGVIINGTGDDLGKVQSIKQDLEELGYDTAMIMVNTSDEVSAQRNIERGQRGGRTVPETVRKEKWDSAQDARTEYAKMFGDNYMEFDNSEDLRNAPPEVVKQKKDEMLQLFTNVKNFVSTPPGSEQAQAWVADQMQQKDSLPVSKKGSAVLPHPESNAAEEAKKLGLQYYGFGRYGRNGEVTHRSVHDKLVEIQNDINEMFTEDLRNWFSKSHPEGGWKRINSKGEAIGPCARKPGEPKPKCMSNEKRASLSKKERAAAVRAKRKHDPNPERKGDPINVSNFGKGKISESYQLSDSSAINLLLLGNDIDEQNLYYNGENDNYDFSEETKRVKLMRDKAGKIRTFMLRRAAAKEAHTHNGVVMKYKNGYVIKLHEENDDARISEESIQTKTTSQWRETSTRCIDSSRGEKILNEGVAELTSGQEYASGTGIETTPTQASGQGKITLQQIRQRKTQKEANDTASTSFDKSTQINEIDKGIEPGLSMATGGENATRLAPKNKAVKKPFEETIGAGGEMATSMSDNEELKLKRKGIDLQSFKAKRPIG